MQHDIGLVLDPGIDASRANARSLSDRRGSGEVTSPWTKPSLGPNLGLGALWWCGRQGGSFGTQPSTGGRLGLGAILRTEIGERLVEHRVALAGGFRHNMPFKALDPVLQRTLRAREHPGEAI